MKSYSEGSDSESEKREDVTNYATRLLTISEMEEIHGSSRMFLAFFVIVIPDMVG